MRKYFAASVAVAAACAAMFSPVGALQARAEAEEYAVYSAMLGEMFAGGRVTFDSQFEVKALVIQERTVSLSPPVGLSGKEYREVLRQRFPSLSQAVIDDYVSKNKKAHSLQRLFNLKLDYTFLRKDDYDRIFKGDLTGSWEKFYQKFPGTGGFVGLSRVGFNQDKSQALVYLHHGCNLTCGSGNYVLLRKGTEGWEVVDKFQMWIS